MASSTSTAIRLGQDTDDGGDVTRDLFSGDLGRTSLAIVAPSGSGREATERLLIRRQMATGTGFLVMDDSPGVDDWTGPLGGRVVGPAGPDRLPLDVLDPAPYRDGDAAAERVLLAVLAGLLGSEPPVDARISAIRALRTATREGTGLGGWLRAADAMEGQDSESVAPLAEALRPWLRDGRLSFMPAAEDLDGSDALTVIRLPYDGSHRPAVAAVAVLAERLNRPVLGGGRRVLAVRDGWAHLSVPTAAAPLLGLAREGRPTGNAVWLSTQSPRDLDGPLGRGFSAGVGTVMILRCRPGEAVDAMGAWGLDADDAERLGRLRDGEFLLLDDEQGGRQCVTPDPVPGEPE